MNRTAEILGQDEVWVDRHGVTYHIDTMDPHYRSNLIPFLRGNAQTLKRIAEEAYYESKLEAGGRPGDDVTLADGRYTPEPSLVTPQTVAPAVIFEGDS